MAKNDDDLDYETTGHEWDGIKEYNKPLPRWWLWTFYATIVWGIGYTIAYPAWPMINQATAGVLGYSTRAEVAEDLQQAEDANAQINTRLVSADLNAIENDEELVSYAVNAGEAVFNTWCVQCHGREGGLGASGYPVLSDDAWIWGGSLEDIHYTIAHGIRNETDPDARWSQMPAFGADGLLSEEEVDQVVNYVMTLSGMTPQDAAAAEAGAEVYDINCSACHGADGAGDRFQGAPNLTDAIWLYDGSDGQIGYDDIHETVMNSRFGVMPAWNDRLSEAEIRAVSVYVHRLGGGEAPAE